MRKCEYKKDYRSGDEAQKNGRKGFEDTTTHTSKNVEVEAGREPRATAQKRYRFLEKKQAELEMKRCKIWIGRALQLIS